MTREDQIENQASKYANDPDNTIEWGDGWIDFDQVFDAFKNGAKWADEHPDSKHTYTKQQLIDMGFAFTTNGDIITPDQSNEDLKKYLKYQKQKFIEKACKWLKENLSEGYDPDNYPMVRCYDIDMEDFIKEFRREMEE